MPSELTRKMLNDPDSITLEDVQRMSEREFRVWSFLEVTDVKKTVHRLDNRLWWVLGSIVTLGVIAITAAVI